MIVWLASYPRSGNSLIRQILFQTMGLLSYTVYIGENQERVDKEISKRKGAGLGSAGYETSFDEFYRQASESDELFLIKTHEMPSDDNPALYVVRDGRSTISSFLRFERKFSPAHPTSMLQLIQGEHYFGSWSQHYRAWTQRPGRTLVLKFPELVDVSTKLQTEIAAFLGYGGPIAEWVNRLEKIRLYPHMVDIVGEGNPTWTSDPGWDEKCDSAFWEQHGALMQELGFHDQAAPQMCSRQRAVIPEVGVK